MLFQAVVIRNCMVSDLSYICILHLLSFSSEQKKEPEAISLPYAAFLNI